MEKSFGKTIKVPTTEEVSFDLGEITPRNASGSRYACRLDTCDTLIPVSVSFGGGKAICTIPAKYEAVTGYSDKGEPITESRKVPAGNLHVSFTISY